MAQSIDLPEEIYEILRREAELQRSSVAEQLAHWLRIGRAIEISGRFSFSRVAAALAAEIKPSSLTDEEHAVWTDFFVEKMTLPGSDEEAFFARRRRLGLGVGLDADGKLVREHPPKQPG